MVSFYGIIYLSTSVYKIFALERYFTIVFAYQDAQI